MPRKQNYGFDKRRKEQERKAKKDAKAAERRQRQDDRSAPTPIDPSETSRPPEPGTHMPPDAER